MCSPPLGCRQENPPRFVSLPEISLHNILFSILVYLFLFLFQTVFLPCLTHKPSWISAQCLSVQRPSCGSDAVLWRAAISFPGRRDGTRNLHLPFHTSSPLLRYWKGFPNSLFLHSYKKEILSTESPSTPSKIISWVLKHFRGILTFVWGFSSAQSLFRVGFYAYPGLFFYYFIFIFHISFFIISYCIMISSFFFH